MAPTMLLLAMRTMASAVSSTSAELLRRRLDGAMGGGGVELHRAAEEVIGVDAAQYDVGVGHRRLVPPRP